MIEFKFICNCHLLGMPQDTYNIWFPHNYRFTHTICILQGLLSETSTNATVLTITSFTIERYIAICHPFRFVLCSLSASLFFYHFLDIVSCVILISTSSLLSMSVIVRIIFILLNFVCFCFWLKPKH